jgi:hypothetical protein
MVDLDLIRRTLAAAALDRDRLARQLGDSANGLAAERARLTSLQAAADANAAHQVAGRRARPPPPNW